MQSYNLLSSLLIMSLFSSSAAQAWGTPEQDPYVKWARDAYEAGRPPEKSELSEGKIWNCTLAFSIENLFYYEHVPTFRFKIEGSTVKNRLLFSNQTELADRRYDFHYGKDRSGNSNLARDIQLGWQVSVGSNWANPETPAYFKMHDSVRRGVGGRLIVQRSVTGRDKERLSQVYIGHNRALGRTLPGYGMPEAIPDFGRTVDADLNKRQYAFQYFVCDRPDGNLPLSSGESEPPVAAAPQSTTVPGPRDFTADDGRVLRCPEGTRPRNERQVEWFTETSATATAHAGEDWFSNPARLTTGQSGQTAEFSRENAEGLNALESLRDSEGHPLNVQAERTYRVKSVKNGWRCVRNP